MMRQAFLVFAILLLTGCSRAVSADTGVDAAKKKWEASGWFFHETFGTAVADAEEVSSMSSATARSVSAFSFDGVARKQKEYIQSDQLYLVVTMADRSGRSYSLVFRQKKRANKSVQRTSATPPSLT